MNPEKRYFTLNAYLRKKYGARVHRVAIDAGFTCPNRDGTISSGGCAYCAEHGARAAYVDPEQSVKDQLLSGIAKISAKTGANLFIAYFQAYTNTYAPVETLEKLYREALSVPGVVGISVGTRPDCIDAEKLDLLEMLAQNTSVLIEYGVQTLNDNTLKKLNRGHDSAASIRAIRETKKRKGIEVLAHLILGLPGDSREDMIESAGVLVREGIDAFKFHQLFIERRTALEQVYRSGGFELLTLEEYIGVLCGIIPILPPEIVIHRLFADADKNKLIAPLWTLEKARNTALLDQVLEEKNIHQGSMIPPVIES